MILNVIFLLTSIVTARLLDKKKMRVASAAYSVTFIFLLVVLLFTAEAEVISRMMVNVLGENIYWNAHFVFLDAIHAPQYGLFIVGALGLTFALQLSVTVFHTVKVVVYHFFKQNTPLQKARKIRFTLLRPVRDLFLSPNINLLYCRMLN